MIRSIQLTVACMAVMVASAGRADAGVILSADLVTTTMGSLGGFPVSAISDQSGLSDNFVSGTTDFAAYEALNPTHLGTTAGARWFSDVFNPLNDNFVDFDLGMEYTIEQIGYWGTNNTLGSIANFNLYTSNDASFATGVTTVNRTFEDPGASDPVSLRTLDILDPSARYVRLEVLTVYTDTYPNASFGEIVFDVGDATAVPEPCSLAVLGIGACVVAARRRRRQQHETSPAV